MRVLYIFNIGRKAFLISVLLLFWILMFITANYLINRAMLFNITVDSCFEFSYPYEITVDKILVSEKAGEKSIQASHIFSAPSAQEFLNYKSLEGKFGFDYPSAFILTPREFQGTDILYHIEFRNKQDTAHGFVQVWNIPGSLADFLNASKALSWQNFKYFKSGSITVNSIHGFYWNYTILDGSCRIKANEVFLEDSGLMYRISYFVPEDEWNEGQLNLFRDIVRSFKIY